MKLKFIALFFILCFTSCFSENRDIFSIKDTEKNIEFSLNDSRAKIEKLYHITEINQDFVSTKGLEIYFINLILQGNLTMKVFFMIIIIH